MNINADLFPELCFGQAELDFFWESKKEESNPKPQEETIAAIASKAISPPTTPKPVRRREEHKTRFVESFRDSKESIFIIFTNLQKTIDPIISCSTSVLSSARHRDFLDIANQLLTHMDSFKTSYTSLERKFSRRRHREIMQKFDKYSEINDMVVKLRNFLGQKVTYANLKIAAFNTLMGLGFIIGQINTLLEVIDPRQEIPRCKNNYLDPGISWYSPDEMTRILELSQKRHNQREQQNLVELFAHQNQLYVNYEGLAKELRKEVEIDIEISRIVRSITAIKFFL